MGALVEAKPLIPFIEELAAAVGSYEAAAERAGCTSMTLWNIRHGRTSRVRQETARGILLAAWPYSTRARSRPAHRAFESKVCAFGNCALEATDDPWCWWHVRPENRASVVAA